MATTTPDNIYYATVADGQDLATVTAAMATSVQLALAPRQIQSFKWANAAARTAQTGMLAGDQGWQVDTGATYVYTTSWVATTQGDTGWISVSTFTNGWTAALAVFYRKKNGVVYLRGQLTGGTTGTAFTLPIGFLPSAANMYYGVWSSGTGTAVMTRLNIQLSGAVVAVSGGSPGLDSVSFPADG